MLDDLYQTLSQSVNRAGALMKARTGERLTVQYKRSWSDLVTELDQAIETEVRRIVSARFPDHGFVGEEGGGGWEREYTWILDPLDGTTNFAHTLPNYVCALACFRGSEPQVAAVYDPNREELFSAIRGRGAWLNGSAITVDQAPSLREAVVGTNLLWDSREGRFPNLEGYQEMGRRVRGIRSLGAAELELAYVACGRYSGFAQFRLAPWDFAAGYLLVTEAGGTVTQLDGSPIQVTVPCGVVASNGRIHREMLELLRP